MYERLKTYLIFICTSMRAQVVFFDLKKNSPPPLVYPKPLY